MSLSAANAITKALLTACQRALSSQTSAGEHFGLTEGGEPPALASDWFIGVHKDPSSQNQPQPGGRSTYIDETFTAQITFSERVTRYASDRVASEGYPEFQDRIRKVASYLSNYPYVVMGLVNASLDLAATNGFIEPFIVQNPSPPIQKRGRSWYKSASKATSQGTLAVSATLRLDGLRRIQIVGGAN